MNIRRICLDVDKASKTPTMFELAEAISRIIGYEAANITITEIDMETVGMDIAIEGNNLDYASVISVIESTGAVVHSVDEIVTGARIIPYAERKR